MVAVSCRANFYALMVIGHGSVRAAADILGVSHNTVKGYVEETTYGADLLKQIKDGRKNRNLFGQIHNRKNNRRDAPETKARTPTLIGFGVTTLRTKIGWASPTPNQ